MKFADLEPEQRDALMFAMNDMVDKNDIIITDHDKEFKALMKKFSGSITHETRRESYDAVKQDAAARRRDILDILSGSGGMTAREIAAELHQRGITPSDERNYSAPRLTELKAAGQIEVTGKKLCDRTGRNVALWAVKEVSS